MRMLELNKVGAGTYGHPVFSADAILFQYYYHFAKLSVSFQVPHSGRPDDTTNSSPPSEWALIAFRALMSESISAYLPS